MILLKLGYIKARSALATRSLPQQITGSGVSAGSDKLIDLKLLKKTFIVTCHLKLLRNYFSIEIDANDQNNDKKYALSNM